MHFSNRILTIIKEIEFDTIADIGTDHGYIAIAIASMLGTKLNIKKIVACDVNKLPLSNCSSNVHKFGFENIITTRLAYGLEKLDDFEVDTVIIAGMGGRLITNILEKSLNKVYNLKQIILQPQSDLEYVRKFVHKIDFKIENENMIYENSNYYNILNCKNLKEQTYDKQIYYNFGKILIQNRNQVLKNFLICEKNKFCNIKNQVLKNYNNQNLDKINNYINLIQEALILF